MIGQASTLQRTHGVAALVVGTLTFACFAGSALCGAVSYDDPQYLTNRPEVLAGWSFEGVRWAFSTTTASNWHPLTWLSLMTDVQLFGVRPALHHLVAVAFHAMSASMLLLLLARSGRTLPAAALAALFFAVHPLRVESVVWIAERKDVLATFLVLACSLCHVHYARNRSMSRWVATTALGMLALLAKPSAVTLPFCLLLLDLWPANRPAVVEGARRLRTVALLLVEKAPLFLGSAIVSLATMSAQSRAMGELTGSTRLANAVTSLGSYLTLTLWPKDLAVFYPYLPARTTAVIASVGLLVAIGAAAVIAWRRGSRGPLIGLLWFVGMLVPMLGIVQVGGQAMADRYTYLPSVGLAFLLAAGLDGALARMRGLPARALTLLCGALVAALAAHTQGQISTWRSSTTLFEHAARARPSDFADIALAGTLLYGPSPRAAGDAERALALATRAVETCGGRTHCRVVLGDALAAAGRPREAIERYVDALTAEPEMADAHEGLARALAAVGELPPAESEMRIAARAKASFAAWHALLEIMERRGRVEEGRSELERMIAEAGGPSNAPPGAVAALGAHLATADDPRHRDPLRGLALARLAADRSFRLDPGALAALVVAAHAAGYLGERELALEALRRAERIRGVRAPIEVDSGTAEPRDDAVTP